MKQTLSFSHRTKFCLFLSNPTVGTTFNRKTYATTTFIIFIFIFTSLHLPIYFSDTSAWASISRVHDCIFIHFLFLFFVLRRRRKCSTLPKILKSTKFAFKNKLYAKYFRCAYTMCKRLHQFLYILFDLCRHRLRAHNSDAYLCSEMYYTQNREICVFEVFTKSNAPGE